MRKFEKKKSPQNPTKRHQAHTWTRLPHSFTPPRGIKGDPPGKPRENRRLRHPLTETPPVKGENLPEFQTVFNLIIKLYNHKKYFIILLNSLGAIYLLLAASVVPSLIIFIYGYYTPHTAGLHGGGDAAGMAPLPPPPPAQPSPRHHDGCPASSTLSFPAFRSGMRRMRRRGGAPPPGIKLAGAVAVVSPSNPLSHGRRHRRRRSFSVYSSLLSPAGANGEGRCCVKKARRWMANVFFSHWWQTWGYFCHLLRKRVLIAMESFARGSSSRPRALPVWLRSVGKTNFPWKTSGKGVRLWGVRIFTKEADRRRRRPEASGPRSRSLREVASWSEILHWFRFLRLIPRIRISLDLGKKSSNELLSFFFLLLPAERGAIFSLFLFPLSQLSRLDRIIAEAWMNRKESLISRFSVFLLIRRICRQFAR